MLAIRRADEGDLAREAAQSRTCWRRRGSSGPLPAITRRAATPRARARRSASIDLEQALARREAADVDEAQRRIAGSGAARL